MAQQDQVAICRGQAANGGLDLGPPFGALVVLLGGRGAALDLQLVRAIGILCFEALSSRGRATQVIDSGIVRDAIKPGRELVLGTVFTERIVNFYENFLRDVERGFVIAKHAKNVARDRALVARYQFLEPLTAAADGMRDQLAIGQCPYLLESQCCGSHLLPEFY